jgi:hypothetical protein
MARTVTLTTMIARVRRETDQEYDTAVVSAPAVTDASITDWINEGIAEAWQQLVIADPDRALTTTTITTVAGTEEYALPSGFVAIRGLDYPVGSYSVDVEPYAFAERNQLQGPSAIAAALGGAAPFRYCVQRNGVSGSAARLSLRPIPTAVVTLTIHYVATPAALSAGADTFDGVLGFEGYAVAYARAKVHGKMQEPDGVAIASADMARVRDNIQAEAGRRDRSGLEVVARVEPRHRYSPFRYF